VIKFSIKSLFVASNLTRFNFVEAPVPSLSIAHVYPLETAFNYCYAELEYVTTFLFPVAAGLYLII